MRVRSLAALTFVLALLLGLLGAAEAGDPRRDIIPLFGGPVPISSCGTIDPATRGTSFVLTRDLFAPAGSDCLRIGTSPATIDLNGFSIFSAYAGEGSSTAVRSDPPGDVLLRASAEIDEGTSANFWTFRTRLAQPNVGLRSANERRRRSVRADYRAPKSRDDGLGAVRRAFRTVSSIR